MSLIQTQLFQTPHYFKLKPISLNLPLFFSHLIVDIGYSVISNSSLFWTNFVSFNQGCLFSIPMVESKKKSDHVRIQLEHHNYDRTSSCNNAILNLSTDVLFWPFWSIKKYRHPLSNETVPTLPAFNCKDPVTLNHHYFKPFFIILQSLK